MSCSLFRKNGQFSLPDILAGRIDDLPDGCALMLMFFPACSLAGTVAVVGKFTLSTSVQVGLVPETAVANLSGQTDKKKDKADKYYSYTTNIFHLNI